MLFEFFRLIVNKVIATDRGVAVGRDINAPVITGDINNSEVNIDKKSFDQAIFLSQANVFDNCANKVPILWATRQCLKMLSPSEKYQEKLEFKFVQNKISFMALVLSNNSDNVKILYYKKSNKEINRNDLKAIAAELLKHCDHVCAIQIIVNKEVSKHVKEYVKKAVTGSFSTKLFNKSKDSFTGLEIIFLKNILANVTLEGLDHYYKGSGFSPYISSDNVGHVSELSKALAVKLLSEASSKEFITIKRHDLEVRFGAEHYGEIFPASPKFDDVLPSKLRNHQESILNSILSEKKNSIIHAPGGVGKTVMARLANTVIPSHSYSIVYDCFGDGLYRSLNSPRHSIDKVLVQIVNELAIIGLCEPLVATNKDKERLMQEFISRIESSICLLKKRNEQANLYIFIDAADNAEMAAKERAENTIVSDLLNDLIIEGCTIIALCRTERVELLNPREGIQQCELSSFNENESFNHLKSHFPKATLEHAKEFHRLSSGNPRVQAYAINDFPQSLNEMLGNLGPTLSTVDQQIEVQLSKAIGRLKSKRVKSEANKIDLICTALASLPPFIPIDVISKLTKFSTAEITSFISDFGRGLMLIDTNIQFRDEPTETWFRKQYASNSQQAKEFVENISPLANTDSYVSECLPYLMLAGENYEDLINLALSEGFLPIDNAIDARSIRTSRLNAALKSALRIKDYLAVIKLAMRTGEEFAGDQRQIELLNENVALICMIQSPSEIQKLAFQGKLSSGWKGSENLYKASLLSVHEEYKGESLGYLRSAENWLKTYFESRKAAQKNRFHEKLSDKDTSELFFVYFNHFGANRTIKRILSWTPAEAMHSAIALFNQKLIDTAKFEAINELANASKEFSYISVHFIASLFSMQRNVGKETLVSTLTSLLDNTNKEHNEANQHIPLNKLFLFMECCIKMDIEKSQLSPLIYKYIKLEPKSWYGSNTNDHHGERAKFIQSVALKQSINGESLSDEELIPSEFLAEEKSYEQKQGEEKYRKMLEATIPLQIFLTGLRTQNSTNFVADYEEVSNIIRNSLPSSYEQKNSIRRYVYSLKQMCIFRADGVSKSKQKELVSDIFENLSYSDLRYGLYHTTRVPRLSHLAELYEEALSQKISSFKGESPESMSSSFVDFSIAIFPLSKIQSSNYFEKAVEAVSKFGNEALVRHMALLSLAEKSAKEKCTPELAYRFSRGSEVIYEYMSDHFPLEKTIKAIHDMDGPSAFAVMARWLDREVAYIGPIEDSLFEHSLNCDSLSAEDAWCAQSFIDNTIYAEFLFNCMKKCKNDRYRNIIFTDAVSQMLIKKTSISTLLKTQKTGAIYNLSLKTLDSAIIQLGEQEEFKEPRIDSLSNSDSDDVHVDWDLVFATSNLTNSKAIETALSKFNDIEGKSYKHNFWEQLYSRTSLVSAIDIINAILNCDFNSRYDLQKALENTPNEWFTREGVKETWLKIFDVFVQQNVSTVLKPWWLEHSKSQFKIEENLSKLRVTGVIRALEDKSDFDDAEFVFSIVSVLSEKLSPAEAQEALSYALERLELHIDNSDADGDWDVRLTPPDNCADAYAAFVWSVLANPTSKTRWEAVHIVCRLVQLECSEVINSMITLFAQDEIGVFSSNEYPFYKYHAQLYFLIAVLRGAQANTSALLNHSSFFLGQALNSGHALIEHFSSRVALKLIEVEPEIYTNDEINKLKAIGLSPFYKSTINRDNNFIEAKIANINKDLPELSFFIDFQEYWLKPLARVFNVSVKELKLSAIDIVINEWGITTDERFIRDPRYYGDKETHSRHTSIPPTQPYDFYLGYHVIFTIASRLLKKLPVVKKKNDWEDDRWQDWLSSYLLSMDNGYFLADLRDPAPLVRRSWLTEEISDSWRWELQYNDFLEGLLFIKDGITFICVTGSWSDNDGRGNNENYSISSALTSSSNSESLLKALVTCNNSYDYKLPSYNEEQFELNDSEFKMKGWLNEPDEYKRLDETDPYAGELKFPLRKISEEYKELLELKYCLHRRSYQDAENNLHGFSETWTDTRNNDHYSESSIREGNRLFISLNALKQLCVKTGLSLIFEVSINRECSTYDRETPDDVKYPGPYCNLYTLSKDGVIEDYQSRSYQLR